MHASQDRRASAIPTILCTLFLTGCRDASGADDPSVQESAGSAQSNAPHVEEKAAAECVSLGGSCAGNQSGCCPGLECVGPDNHETCEKKAAAGCVGLGGSCAGNQSGCCSGLECAGPDNHEKCENKPASTHPIAPSVGDCPGGYIAARANRSYYGGAAGVGPPDAIESGQTTGSVPTEDEFIGLACFKRASPTRGTLQFRWSAVGPLDEGILYYQLYDCTARTVARQHSKTLEYKNGSESATSGQDSTEFTLDPAHKYAARVTGQGVYERPGQSLGGSLGYFNRYGAPEPFFDQSLCQ